MSDSEDDLVDYVYEEGPLKGPCLDSRHLDLEKRLKDAEARADLENKCFLEAFNQVEQLTEKLARALSALREMPALIRAASLPEGYQWGADARDNFEFGKICAARDAEKALQELEREK